MVGSSQCVHFSKSISKVAALHASTVHVAKTVPLTATRVTCLAESMHSTTEVGAIHGFDATLASVDTR